MGPGVLRQRTLRSETLPALVTDMVLRHGFGVNGFGVHVPYVGLEVGFGNRRVTVRKEKNEK